MELSTYSQLSEAYNDPSAQKQASSGSEHLILAIIPRGHTGQVSEIRQPWGLRAQGNA